MKKLLKSSIKKHRKKQSTARFFVVVILSLCFAGVYFSYETIESLKDRRVNYNRAYQDYLSKNNATVFQDLLIKDIKNGINDKYTKSDAYFIIQRYFNNGGNIYEVYDYVNSHPELVFMKEAEDLQPVSFDKVEKRHLPFTYSDDGMYVYLAYLEILQKHGYADIAIAGSLAGQYAKMAYYKKMIREDKSIGKSLSYPDYTQDAIDLDINKALFFSEKIKNNLPEIISEATTSNSIVNRDLLIGSIQYASALRYLQASGVNFHSPVTSGDIFSFAVSLAHKSIPELYLSTAIANASTLLLVKPNNNELRNAVYPFFDFNSRTNKPTGVVDKVLKSRFEKSISRFSDLNANSRTNIVALANKVPEFKKWLLSNDWGEDDFR